MRFPFLCAQNSTQDRRSILFSRDKKSGKKSKKLKKSKAGSAMRLAWPGLPNARRHGAWSLEMRHKNEMSTMM